VRNERILLQKLGNGNKSKKKHAEKLKPKKPEETKPCQNKETDRERL